MKNESLSSPEIKQFLTDFRKINREKGEMEVAPLRTLDDFILTKSRFQVNLRFENHLFSYFFDNCVRFSDSQF